MTVRRLLKHYNGIGSEVIIHEMNRPNKAITLSKGVMIRDFGRRGIIGWDAYVSPSHKAQLEIWIYG